VTSPAPTTTPDAAATKGPPSADRLEQGRPEIRKQFCSDGALYRVCYAVPDEATCNATFDQAWPECTRGVLLHDGASEANRNQGRQTGRCITQAFRSKFALTVTKACATAMEAMGGGQ
jgi:hypothetical protein